MGEATANAGAPARGSVIHREMRRAGPPHLRQLRKTTMRRGLYRIFGTDGRPNDVRVDDEGISVPVEEGLPWEEDYLRQQAPTKP